MRQLPSEIAELPEGAWVESYDARMAATASATPNGGVRAATCWLSKVWTLSSVSVAWATAPTVPTNGWCGIWKHDTLALVAVTNDIGATAIAANSIQTYPFAAPTWVPESGLYYVGVCVVGATPGTVAIANMAPGRRNIPPYLSQMTGAGLYTTPATAPNPFPLTIPPTGGPPYVYVS